MSTAAYAELRALLASESFDAVVQLARAELAREGSRFARGPLLHALAVALTQGPARTGDELAEAVSHLETALCTADAGWPSVAARRAAVAQLAVFYREWTAGPREPLPVPSEGAMALFRQLVAVAGELTEARRLDYAEPFLARAAAIR